MELKKAPKADLEGKRGLFLEIGLCLSLVAMIGTFAWGAGTRKAAEPITPPDVFVPMDYIENTVQNTPVPQMPSPKQMITTINGGETIIIAPDTQVKTTTVVWNPEGGGDFLPGPYMGGEIGSGADSMPDFFENVAFMPQFQGGDYNTFIPWVLRRVRYPEMAAQMGITGEVVVRFIVEKDGSLSNFEVTSPTDKTLNNEALRVIKQSPRWTPGRQITEPVRVRMQIPVKFQL